MFNKTMICGRLVNDLQLKTTTTTSNDGVNTTQKYCYFTVAVNNVFNPQITNFIPCVAWNRVAENMERFLRKGSLILVEGTLRSRTVNTEQNTRLTQLSLRADNVVFLESKRATSPKTDPYPSAPTTPSKDQISKPSATTTTADSSASVTATTFASDPATKTAETATATTNNKHQSNSENEGIDWE